MEISQSEKEQEKKYLQNTLQVIRSQISNLGQQLFDKEEKIQEFKELVWDSKHDMDPSEMRQAMIENDQQVFLLAAKGRYFQTLFRIQSNPYFGKIKFQEGNTERDIYIGITHVDENHHHFVYDWRSPICSLFYDYEIGPASYEAPEGTIEGNLKVKRQFKIEDGKLLRIFDNSLAIDDDVLQEVLASEGSDKMKNIVNTIQQEQNQVIRNVEDKVLVVQGVAGSGKTSVALHRIAFLLYKIPNLSSDNVLIFSPNKIFSEYISNVLPELGERNTLQTTFDQFLSEHSAPYKEVETFTHFLERYYKREFKNKEWITYKQSDIVITDLEDYMRDFLAHLAFQEDLEVEGRLYPKNELTYLLQKRYSHLLLTDRFQAMAEKICNQVYEGKRSKLKQIESSLKKILNHELDRKKIYASFYQSPFFQRHFSHPLPDAEIQKLISRKQLSYEDACLFIYLKGLMEDFSYHGRIQQIVIDEAQDYNKLQYRLIHQIFKRSSFTILGDVNQTINPYYHYSSLEELKEIWKDLTYIELKKTYRSSEEIIDFANQILGLDYVSAIRKSNHKEVLEREKGTLSTLKEDILRLRKEYSSVAVITKTDEEAKNLYEALNSDFPEITLLESATSSFQRHFVIVPSYLAKGLEFDSVIIYTALENAYTKEEKYLYYVAVTRAQHELVVYHQPSLIKNNE